MREYLSGKFLSDLSAVPQVNNILDFIYRRNSEILKEKLKLLKASGKTFIKK